MIIETRKTLSRVLRNQLPGMPANSRCSPDTRDRTMLIMIQSRRPSTFPSPSRPYAHDRWALLVVLQGMDAAGKDGIIKHVMSGINPQGCEVHPFKAPCAEELEHDFLWRAATHLPERGHIGIFNRSHYEEVLVVRVHPDMLARQKLPEVLVTKDIWKERFKDIRDFTRHLARNGVAVLKFFLLLSKEEQRRRLLARLDEP